MIDLLLHTPVGVIVGGPIAGAAICAFVLLKETYHD